VYYYIRAKTTFKIVADKTCSPGNEKRKLTALMATAIQMLVVLEEERPAISTIVAE
jgi:hypothetical protein